MGVKIYDSDIYVKVFSERTFVCVWSRVLNEGRKLSKDVHASRVRLWVSCSQLDVPAHRNHTGILKTHPQKTYRLYGVSLQSDGWREVGKRTSVKRRWLSYLAL